jgi:hypothetical protein
MQPRTGLLSTAAFALGAALAFGTAAIAADLPKEGTFNATQYAAGTFQPTGLGKERWFGSSEDYGVSLGSGLPDHMSWNCWGVADGTNSIAQFRGYCVHTDPEGDQIATDYVSDGKIDLAKPYVSHHTIRAGTGKYAGISGVWTAVCHSGEFKTAAKGTYAQLCNIQGSYKLP